MTQTLIEQLEALPRYAPNIGGDMIYSGQAPETLKWVNADDLSAIIEQHKQQPDIVAELVKALEDDAYAASFQSMAGYRKWLLDLAKGVGK